MLEPFILFDESDALSALKITLILWILDLQNVQFFHRHSYKSPKIKSLWFYLFPSVVGK